MKLEYRQGDVGIDKVDSIPSEAKLEKRDRVILAYGEVTGHCHEIAVEDLEKIELFMLDGKMYLNVKEDGVKVTHQEHAIVTLPIGNYEVIHQREYSPEAIRNVLD